MRQTKAQLQAIATDLHNKLEQQTLVASNYYKEATGLKEQLRLLNTRFDKLIDAIYFGMKEGTVPRKGTS